VQEANRRWCHALCLFGTIAFAENEGEYGKKEETVQLSSYVRSTCILLQDSKCLLDI